MSALTLRQRASPAPAIVDSGRASRVSVLPMATPMRRSPKSKASNSAGVINGSAMKVKRSDGRPGPCGSGMTGLPRQARWFDTQQVQRRGEALLGRRLENDRGIGIDGEPRVRADLLLELAGTPARIAERHQHLLRSAAARDRFEHIFGGGERDALAHRETGAVVARGLMQHEAALGLHRATEKNRLVLPRGDLEREINLGKQRGERQIGRPVDD